MRTRALIASLACLILVPLNALGCSSFTPVSDPQGYLNEAYKNFAACNSYGMSMEMKMEMSGFGEDENMHMAADGGVSKDASGNFVAKMDFKIANPDMPSFSLGKFVLTTYIGNDKLYIQDPRDEQWYYQPLYSSGDPFGMMNTLDPSYERDFVQRAKEVLVANETSTSIKYEFKINLDQLLELMKQQWSSIGGDKGNSAEELDFAMEILRRLFEHITFSTVIDKKTQLPTEFSFTSGNLVTYMQYLAPDEPAPPGAVMRMSAKLRFSDFGKDFQIVLPPETQNALPAPSSGLLSS